MKLPPYPSRLMIGIFALLTLMVSALGLFYPIHVDEAVFLTIAREVSLGRLPYRDVFDHKPPGIYYLFAPLMSWIGSEVVRARLVILGVNLVSGMLLFSISYRRLGRLLSVLLALFWLIGAQYYQGSYVLTEPLAVVWMLTAVLVTTGRKATLQRAVTAGICLGVAGLFKQTAMLMLPAFWWLWVNSEMGVRLPVVLTIGSIIPWVAVGGWLAANGVVEEAFFSIVTFNVLVYPKKIGWEVIRFLPVAVFPFGAVWGMALVGWVKAVKRKVEVWETFLGLTIGLLALSLPVRPYHHYWLLVFPWVLLLVFGQLKHRQEWLWLLSVNILLFTIFFTQFGIGRVPDLLESQTQIMITCGDVKESYQYWLSQCPVPKYFYQPDLPSGQ